MSCCSSTCPTQDHESWGQCIKAKGLVIAAVDSTVNGHSTKGAE